MGSTRFWPERLLFSIAGLRLKLRAIPPEPVLATANQHPCALIRFSTLTKSLVNSRLVESLTSPRSDPGLSVSASTFGLDCGLAACQVFSFLSLVRTFDGILGFRAHVTTDPIMFST